MIHSNTRFIVEEVSEDFRLKSRWFVLGSILITSLLFAGLATVNVLALDHNIIIEQEISACEDLLNDAQEMGLSVESEYCDEPQPYILGYSLRSVQDSMLALRVRIEQHEDNLREERRVLIDDQKNILDQLAKFGLDEEVVIPDRDISLSDQVFQLRSIVIDLSTLLTTSIEDFSLNLELYKFYQFDQGFDDVLGIRDQLSLSQNIEVFSEKYQEIVQQNEVWMQQVPVDIESDIFDFQIYTPQDFIRFADTRITPGEQKQYVIITGTDIIDRKIVDRAWERGYRPRQEVSKTELVFAGQYQLETEAARAWFRLERAAQADGVDLDLISGYRSTEFQREIFTTRLRDQAFRALGRDLEIEDVDTAIGIEIINKTLELTAPPGYSKHHTGKAIDISYQGDAVTKFADSPGFEWISRNNYTNAKKYGFLPSYPENAVNTGPNPEAWEYVFVGTIQ
jgi:D-alanyl-D-alanine carboxypeptidase